MSVRNSVMAASGLLALASGCVGMRSEARPSSSDGYSEVELPAGGLINQNIQVVAEVGPVTKPDDSCKVVRFPLMRSGDNDIGALGSGTIVATLPASRAAELGKLHQSDLVRVRGYISDFEAEGCGTGAQDHERFLWVDSIQATHRQVSAEN